VDANTKKALQGVRVLELGPYVALPLTGRILASLGAEVIKVETNKVLDEMSFIPAWSRGAGQPDFQRIKKRVSIDVRTPGGLEVFRELVKVSDVFMTNFRRNILDRWGIDFPAVRRLRPDIILMWQTGLGGIGPYYTQVLRHSGAAHGRRVPDDRRRGQPSVGHQYLLLRLSYRRVPALRHHRRPHAAADDRRAGHHGIVNIQVGGGYRRPVDS